MGTVAREREGDRVFVTDDDGFLALRVDGTRFPSSKFPVSLTGEELGEDFVDVNDEAMASSLLAEARAAVSVRPAIDEP